MKKILSLMFIVLAIASTGQAFNTRLSGPNRPLMPPPPPPGYNDIYGPGRTVRWQDMGVVQAQKFIAIDVNYDVRGQFVNELFLVALDNHIGIKSAQARLSNGQVIELRHLTGTVRKDQQLRLRLDYNYSLRIETLLLTIESPNLVGSRASLGLQLGLAY